MDLQKMLDDCKISPKLLNYIENFNYPYVNDVQMFYEQLLKIGQGTFGEVFKARCKRTGQLVALKKILMENEKEGFPITALREIKMLKLLRHPNITELIEVCTCKQRNARERFSFYLVFTFCEHDLAGLLSNTKIQFSLVEMKTMAKHILEGLNKIHKSNILHRDMKSANVLITAGGVLKLADFGLARLMIKQPDYRYTNRVVTLWYRPPELLLGSSTYGPLIDIWGAGCIIAELWIRSPILQGNTEQEQLQRISKLCGSMNPESWPGIEQMPLYGKLNQNGLHNAVPQNYPRRVRERIGPFLKKWADSQERVDDLEEFAHYLAFTTQQNELALALIDQTLQLCPDLRPTAEAALDHNFFWETPLAAENIKDLVDKLKGTNLFEYTSGCGAHANRKRPVAPAAPGHGSGSIQSSSSQPQRKPPAPPAPNSHVPQPKQVQQPRPAVQTRPEPIASTSGRPTSSIAEQLPPIENRMGGVHKQHNVPNAHPFITGPPQQSRKRPAPGPDEFNTPPPLRRPTPLSAARMPQVWQQPQQQQQQHAIYQQQQREPRAVEFAAAAQQQQQWHQQQQQFQPPSTRLLHATSVPRQAWPSSAHQQSRYLHNTGQVRVPIPPPASQQQQQQRQFPPQNGGAVQPNYNRQPPPHEQQPTRFFNNTRY